MINREEAIAKTKTIFNTASDYFDAPALSFWNRFGQQTVERLSLSSGDLVLEIDQLEPSARERVRQANLEFLRTNNVHSLSVYVLYAIAQK
ncbi:hypothetical protein [Nostoc commune]|uniref:hypothetical protein n=1 Tax=Nostoc commune TaxID=1178 RepID=UPI0018C57E71|nr:hypothetical protein [Nostoc commune]MBG1259367.1 hypothetical protein [Nostoc commune BAE]